MLYTCLLNTIYLHLAFGAVEFQAESSAVAQLQIERFLPLRLLAASLHTVAQGIADAMATLHQERLALGIGNHLLVDTCSLHRLEVHTVGLHCSLDRKSVV